MVKINYLDIPAGQELDFWKIFQPSDRYYFSSMQSKPLITTRRHKKGLSQRTLLPTIAELWAGLTQEEKDAWTAAGEVTGSNGYRLFTQDTCYRLSHEIEGIASPNLLHQHKVGKIIISGSANSILLAQPHPSSYYVLRKIRGTQSQYQPVKITENFGLPLEIALSYKSNLTASGDNPSAKVYADIISSYQGVDVHQIVNIDLDLVADWKQGSATATTLLGYFIGYSLFIDIVDLQGTLEFDNVEATHSGSNFARDPHCNNIDTTFTKAFYQIPKHWIQINPEAGAGYDTIYPED